MIIKFDLGSTLERQLIQTTNFRPFFMAVLLKKWPKKCKKIYLKKSELGQRPFGSAHEKFNAWIEAVPKPKILPEPGEKNGRGVYVLINSKLAHPPPFQLSCGPIPTLWPNPFKCPMSRLPIQWSNAPPLGCLPQKSDIMYLAQTMRSYSYIVLCNTVQDLCMYHYYMYVIYSLFS